MARAPQISTTTHALAGLLAIRSWTAYELTQQMRRALRWAWPRSEANLYNEIRRLVPLGIADSVEEESGGRTRARYQLTEEGRRELQAWLRTEPAPVQVQFETLLRLFLADQGSLEELRDTIAVTRRQAVESIAGLLPIVEEYAGDDPPFPGRAHLNILFIHFIAGFLRLVLDWCDDAAAELATWPRTAEVGATDGTRRMAREALAFYRAAVVERAEHSP